MVVLAICGGILISSSVAPTEEILKIAIISEAPHLLAMVAISILISGVILFFSDFRGSSSFKGGTKKMILHLLISYLCALTVSLLLLWFFGRMEGYSFEVVLAEVVVLAIPATLGASAGRLLIDNN